MSLFNINCKHIMNELIDNLFALNIVGKLGNIHGMSDGVWKAYFAFYKARLSLRFFHLNNFMKLLKMCWRAWNARKKIIILWKTL